VYVDSVYSDIQLSLPVVGTLFFITNAPGARIQPPLMVIVSVGRATKSASPGVSHVDGKYSSFPTDAPLDQSGGFVVNP
jgi:hypothetical protein